MIWPLLLIRANAPVVVNALMFVRVNRSRFKIRFALLTKAPVPIAVPVLMYARSAPCHYKPFAENVFLIPLHDQIINLCILGRHTMCSD